MLAGTVGAFAIFCLAAENRLLPSVSTGSPFLAELQDFVQIVNNDFKTELREENHWLLFDQFMYSEQLEFLSKKATQRNGMADTNEKEACSSYASQH